MAREAEPQKGNKKISILFKQQLHYVLYLFYIKAFSNSHYYLISIRFRRVLNHHRLSAVNLQFSQPHHHSYQI